ncbi:unannotated protein [freshwater metagenome]|uniref:Unannotated protein n=1 Tax=freshwater metagenome TaxID=449393 RepID=A0A6J7V4F8_9ZZZZ|nr:FkbM family methyltransferase [Actinomycetota bacterium]MSV71269.1 FkbM family methyltransferase [Actinomycetota bacterium]MSZ73605.1 FkbM family methyltransferase [Actinomycetota bacterium]MTA54919.1 FkbM family methyltransferase [Actinomycetota bacterium]
MNFKSRLIRFSYWRINPIIVKKYFEDESQGLSSYLKMGERGKRAGEVKKSYLRERLGNSQLVIEVGANDGRDTIELALIFPEAVIHAIECDVRLFSVFLARTKAFTNVIFYPFAASDNFGFSSFYESHGGSLGSSSLLPPNLIKVKNPDICFNSNRKVLTGKISDLIQSIDCKFVDLLWMDVQGAEFMILDDLKSHLPRIGAIYLEVEMSELYKGEALFPDISKLLQSHGFFIAEEFRSVEKLENVLFLNASFHNVS